MTTKEQEENKKWSNAITEDAKRYFPVFLVLKLTGLIAWSWWWVTSPIWGALILYFIAAVLIRIKYRKYD